MSKKFWPWRFKALYIFWMVVISCILEYFCFTVPHSQNDAPPSSFLGSSLRRSICWSTDTNGDLEVPTQAKGLQANTADTVLLNWTSTLPSTILPMWCQDGTDGGNFALGSSVSFLQLKTRVELTCIVCSARRTRDRPHHTNNGDFCSCLTSNSKSSADGSGHDSSTESISTAFQRYAGTSHKPGQNGFLQLFIRTPF